MSGNVIILPISYARYSVSFTMSGFILVGYQAADKIKKVKNKRTKETSCVRKISEEVVFIKIFTYKNIKHKTHQIDQSIVK